MEEIVKNIVKSIPFTYITPKGEIKEGLSYNKLIHCNSCSKSCLDLLKKDSTEQIGVCKKGFNTYKANFGDYSFLIIGLIIEGHSAKFPRKLKKELQEFYIKKENLDNWYNNSIHLFELIQNYSEQKIKDNFALFHDIIPSVSLVFRTIESILSKYNGETMDEKIENADIDHRTLYHAMDLLDNRLKMMPLIGNPESAKFGQINKCSVYKVLDKLRRLFKESAKRKNVNIKLNSSSYITNEPLVYDSFFTIPFVLIENAIKYSVNNSDVNIYVKNVNKGVNVVVESVGPIITETDKEKIFEKGFKDPNGRKFSSKGSGLGLYIADIVARAHNFEIEYNCNSISKRDDIIIGNNIFHFTIN